jgi:hypothetical protein
MDGPTKKENSELLTEAEQAEIFRAEQELLAGWIKNLSPEESGAWLDAHEEDVVAKRSEVEREIADFEAVMQVERGGRNPVEAMESLRKKQHKTLSEAEALDCYDRIKFKLIRLCYNLTPVSQKIVNLLEARRTTTKADFQRLLATSDPETLERWEALWKEWQHQEDKSAS